MVIVRVFPLYKYAHSSVMKLLNENVLWNGIIKFKPEVCDTVDSATEYLKTLLAGLIYHGRQVGSKPLSNIPL